MSTGRAGTLVELADADTIRAAWPVVRQLRTHLTEDGFVAMVGAMRAEGYRAIALLRDNTPCAYAGFRILTMLAHGRLLYVDDLVTDESARDTGAGRALMAWLVGEARRHGCAGVQLDSGVQRFAAHAFYFGRGMRIAAHHFALALDDHRD
jgi:GNAT superfamily N-acetyltransferase